MASPLIYKNRPTDLVRKEWRFDYSSPSGGPGGEVAATALVPSETPRALLFCLPGGYLSRSYYDLRDATDTSFSFAEHMAGKGFATLAVDHLGVGESDRPSDGWSLGIDAVCDANQFALVEGSKRVEVLTGQRLPSIGVGHSMGSALSVAQQANYGVHAVLVLFSFSTRGLRGFLQGRELDFADDPVAASEQIGQLAKERFDTPYPEPIQRSGPGSTAAFSAGNAGPRAEALLQKASTNLLPVPGLLTMIPGGFRPYAEQVRVPSFIAVGDHDLHGSNVGADLPNALEVETYTQADCWHCHHVSNQRAQLWDRVALWLHAQLDAVEAL